MVKSIKSERSGNFEGNCELNEKTRYGSRLSKENICNISGIAKAETSKEFLRGC